MGEAAMGGLAKRSIARASGVALALLLWAASGPVCAQDTAAAKAEAPPAKVQELLQLLDDPAVRDWLAQRRGAPAQPASPPAATESAPADSETMPSSYFAQRVASIREHLTGLVAAVPTLPHEFARCFI